MTETSLLQNDAQRIAQQQQRNAERLLEDEEGADDDGSDTEQGESMNNDSDLDDSLCDDEFVPGV